MALIFFSFLILSALITIEVRLLLTGFFFVALKSHNFISVDY